MRRTSSAGRALRLAVALAAGVAVLGLVTACGSKRSQSAGSSARAGASTGKKKTIAVALIAPVGLLENNITAFKSELAKLGYVSGRNVTYKDYDAEGQDSNVPTIVQQIEQLNPALVYAVGTPINLSVMQRLPHTPQVFGVMSNPLTVKIVKSLQHPGGESTGTTGHVPGTTALAVIQSALPDVKKIGVIGNIGEPNTVSDIDGLKAAAKARGIGVEVHAVTTTADVSTAIKTLSGVQALFIPGDNTVVSAISTVAKTAEQMHLPTFDPYGASLAQSGIMVAFGPDYTYLGTSAGQIAAKILGGASPADIPVVGEGSPGVPDQLDVNKTVAKAVGYTPTKGLLKRATTVIP